MLSPARREGGAEVRGTTTFPPDGDAVIPFDEAMVNPSAPHVRENMVEQG
jgi:hypothetical protein